MYFRMAGLFTSFIKFSLTSDAIKSYYIFASTDPKQISIQFHSKNCQHVLVTVTLTTIRARVLNTPTTWNLAHLRTDKSQMTLFLNGFIYPLVLINWHRVIPHIKKITPQREKKSVKDSFDSRWTPNFFGLYVIGIDMTCYQKSINILMVKVVEEIKNLS